MDFLIVGGGIIGLSIARELKKRHHGARILLIEKEDSCGTHASGRNSGVLHAGFYYSADSLKARFTRQGNIRLTEYCEARKIPVKKCGKLVLAKNEAELPWLDELLQRGEKNGVPLQSISVQEAREIEPRMKTFHRALYSPTTSSIDPGRVVDAVKRDALAEGVQIETGIRYLARSGHEVLTSMGKLEADYLVNAAGLYADTIARDFGFSKTYRILPFKGLYLYSNEPPQSFRTNLYPVPDLLNPFLGVHFTVTAEGKTKIGPTAIPAFWREQYEGFENFDWGELIEILFRQAGLFLKSNFDFKKLAYEEIRKYSRNYLVNLASELAEGINPNHFTQWGRPGIRAQLFDLKTKKLEMDFVLEGDAQSLHVLNAVSPAFTCAFPFAEFVCDRIGQLRT